MLILCLADKIPFLSSGSCGQPFHKSGPCQAFVFCFSSSWKRCQESFSFVTAFARAVLLLFRLFRFLIGKTRSLLICGRVCCRRRTRLDHRFSLRRHPETVDRRLIPDRFAVLLHLEADLRFLVPHRLPEHYSERAKHPSSPRHPTVPLPALKPVSCSLRLG